MRKKIGIIKIRVLSGKATPAPPIGPALGQKGINIMNFCKNFNNKTTNIVPPVLLSVIITYYSDKTFDFTIKKPTISFMVKKLLNLDKLLISSNNPISFSINIYKIKELVEYKFSDLNTNNFYSAYKTILGSLKSFGIILNI